MLGGGGHWSSQEDHGALTFAPGTLKHCQIPWSSDVYEDWGVRATHVWVLFRSLTWIMLFKADTVAVQQKRLPKA